MVCIAERGENVDSDDSTGILSEGEQLKRYATHDKAHADATKNLRFCLSGCSHRLECIGQPIDQPIVLADHHQ